MVIMCSALLNCIAVWTIVYYLILSRNMYHTGLFRCYMKVDIKYAVIAAIAGALVTYLFLPSKTKKVIIKEYGKAIVSIKL